MLNLRLQLSRIANLMLLPTTFTLVIGFNNSTIAQTLYSRDGELKIQRLRSYQSACATGKPRSSYYVKNGATGLLYPSKCGGPGTDIAFYKFVDTTGNLANERCRGTAVFDLFGRGIITTWKIEGAVPGYNCSTVGKTYEVQIQ